MDAEKKIVVASDHAGCRLKQEIKSLLEQKGYMVEDVGTYGTESADYPDYGYKAALKVAAGECGRGVLVCGSGIGMCMAANRLRGVRAVNCTEPVSARLSRLHNDSNVLCLGERMIGVQMAREIVEVWLSTGFEGGRHKRRVEKLDELGGE
ncbi:MAG: ribose 5-phosphate isomerase B [bacterium]